MCHLFLFMAYVSLACVCVASSLFSHVCVCRLLQRQKDLNNVNDMLGALHKSVARASALPDYKEKKAEYVRGPRVLCRLVCSRDIPSCLCLSLRSNPHIPVPFSRHISC